MKQDFERNRLEKPLKPLKSCFKLGEKSRLGIQKVIYIGALRKFVIVVLAKLDFLTYYYS